MARIATTLSLLILLSFISQLSHAETPQSGNACDSPHNLVLRTRSGFQVNYIRYSHEETYQQGRLILLYPPTGGVTQVDRRFARKFCRAGYNAIVIESFTDYHLRTLEIGYNDIILRNTLRATRLLRQKYQHKFFGMFGISAGGIAAATLVDDFAEDLDAIFLITVGGPLHSIIARAGETGLKELRERRMRFYGFSSIEEYESAIQESLSMTIPERVSPKLKVGMLFSTEDTIVPDIFQLNLALNWNPDHTVQFGFNHVQTIVKASAMYRDEVVDFFNEAANLGPQVVDESSSRAPSAAQHETEV